MAIVQSDVFEAIGRRKVPGTEDIKNRIRYITKLYNEEIHILVGQSIVNVRDLNGRRVSIGSRGSGTVATSSIIFDALEIPIEPVKMPNSEAIAAVRSGAIAAAVFVTGKPASYFSDIPASEGLRFLKVEIDRKLEERGYISEKLTHKAYPGLVPKGRPVETIAVGAVMAVFRWKKTSSHYNRTKLFSKLLFENLPKLQSSKAYHPKWKQVDPKTEIRGGWTRFEPVVEMLKTKKAK